jgi:hypothetical protein
LPSTTIRKSKSSNGFKAKPRNMNISHGQTFGTTVKPSILVPFIEDGLILSFYATERTCLKRKYRTIKRETRSATPFSRRNDMLRARTRVRDEGRIGS